MTEERFLTHFDTSASALTAERMKMRLIANNIANINTTRTEDGGPYKRVEAMVAARQSDTNALDTGVYVEDIVIDNTPPRMVYNPSHPDANAEGYVAFPNVDLVTETANLRQARLAYEANTTVIESLKKTINTALTLSDG